MTEIMPVPRNSHITVLRTPPLAAGLLHFMQRRIYMPMIASFSDPFGTPDKLHGSVRAVGETGIGSIRRRYVDERGEAVGGKAVAEDPSALKSLPHRALQAHPRGHGSHSAVRKYPRSGQGRFRRVPSFRCRALPRRLKAVPIRPAGFRVRPRAAVLRS